MSEGEDGLNPPARRGSDKAADSANARCNSSSSLLSASSDYIENEILAWLSKNRTDKLTGRTGELDC